MLMRTGIAAIAAAAGMTLIAPTANAQFISDIFVAEQVGSSLDIYYSVATDSPPFTCKLTVRDLDQFGKVFVSARAYNTGGATFRTTTGPYVSGHRVNLELFCTDRRGSTLAAGDTVVIS